MEMHCRLANMLCRIHNAKRQVEPLRNQSDVPHLPRLSGKAGSRTVHNHAGTLTLQPGMAVCLHPSILSRRCHTH